MITFVPPCSSIRKCAWSQSTVHTFIMIAWKGIKEWVDCGDGGKKKTDSGLEPATPPALSSCSHSIHVNGLVGVLPTAPLCKSNPHVLNYFLKQRSYNRLERNNIIVEACALYASQMNCRPIFCPTGERNVEIYILHILFKIALPCLPSYRNHIKTICGQY